MASIIINVSNDFDSTLNVSKVKRDGECMSFISTVYISPDNLYARDWVTVNGTLSALRAFVKALAESLPVEDDSATAPRLLEDGSLTTEFPQ